MRQVLDNECECPERALFANGIGEFGFGVADKARIEQIRVVLFKSGAEALPRLKVIANRALRGLLDKARGP